jgi:hypothetical protein
MIERQKKTIHPRNYVTNHDPELSFLDLLETVKQDPEEPNQFAQKVNDVEFNELSPMETGYGNIITKIQNIKKERLNSYMENKEGRQRIGQCKKRKYQTDKAEIDIVAFT